MQTLTLILYLVGGAFGLYLGAELLVRYAAKLALSLGMTHLMTGITIVAFSTSTPELASSLMAQLQGGYGDISLGNVIGTNISNSALIVGALALIKPMKIDDSAWKVEAPLNVVATILLGLVMLSLHISRTVGIIFCALLIAYIIRHIWMREEEEEPEEEFIPLPKKLFFIFLIVLGALILTCGGYVLVKGAVQLAKLLNVSDRVIGLIVVALGTSLPEFAASCVALLKKMTDVALGNIFGSNVYNILMVLGIVAIVDPIYFTKKLLVQDYPILLGVTLILWFLTIKQECLGRLKGVFLICCYAGYISFLLLTR